MMIELPAPVFTDGRGLYCETVAFGAPRGLRELIHDAAKREGVSQAEFLRRAVACRVAATNPKAQD